MPNPFFSGRIPQELEAHIEKYREETGESKTDLLVKALAAYTGFNIEESTEESDKENIKGSILDRLNNIEQKLQHLNNLEEKILGLEERLNINTKPNTNNIDSAYQQKTEIDSSSYDNHDNSIDNKIILTETQMAKAIGISRDKIRYHRTKIEQHKEPVNSAIEAEIEGKVHKITYIGKNGGSKGVLWKATPIETN